MQEWLSWLESSLKTMPNDASQPLSHTDKRLKHQIHTSESAASMEKIIKISADEIMR